MELVNRGDLETMGRIKVKLGSCAMAVHVSPLISITSALEPVLGELARDTEPLCPGQPLIKQLKREDEELGKMVVLDNKLN